MSNGNIDPFDLPSVIRTLESATSRPDGLPPLLHFLEGLCQLLQEDLPAEITADLHSWVDEFARREGIPPHQIMRLRLSSPPIAPPAVTGYVITELWSDGPDQHRYLSRISLRYGDRRDQAPHGRVFWVAKQPLPLTEIPTLFESVLSEVWDDTTVELDRLIIEFLLPFRILDHAVDQWPIQTDMLAHPVCVEHVVVIRSRDRQTLRSSHPQWRQKTRRLRNGWAATHWADPNGSDESVSQLFYDLVGDGAPCLALLNPPVLPPILGKDAISIAIQTGVPVIVWCRNTASAASFERRLRAFLNSNDPIDLPNFIHQLRKDCVRFRDPTGDFITLMWDLADEPVGLATRLQAPGT